MPLASDRYFIRADYQPNLVRTTYDVGVDAAYWNRERLRTAAAYQHDVYAAAAAALGEKGADAILDVGSGPPVKIAAHFPIHDLLIHLVDQPNTAPLAAELLPQAHFTPADLEVADIDLGADFPFVIFADVIEHLVNPDPCLVFIRRHLRPDGLLYISTPERDVLRGSDCKECLHPMHVREWNRTEFRTFLRSRGFDLVEHRLLPQHRVSPVRKFMGGLLNAMERPPRWYSCQMAVCRKR